MLLAQYLGMTSTLKTVTVAYEISSEVYVMHVKKNSTSLRQFTLHSIHHTEFENFLFEA